MSRRRMHQHGLATLESAMIVTAFFAVCIGVAAVVDFLNRTDAAYQSLDRELHNSRVKGASFEANPESVALSINHLRIREFVETIKDRVEASRVEVGYTIANIDADTGALIGIQPVNFRATSSGGQPRSDADCPGLETELVRFSTTGAGQTPSFLAVPDGGTSQTRYLPEVVLVAARAEVDLTDAAFTRNTISLIGMNPVVTICSVAALRGEISVQEL